VTATPAPLGLIAEITHRCPLHCVYCSNPIELAAQREELATEDWLRIFEQAQQLGILQLFLTGGEPLARKDLTELVRSAREHKLYVNLITSGIGLNAARLDELVTAGLDHIQLSFQDSDAAAADEIAGARAHALKLQIAQEINRRDLGFTVNIVVHRRNLARLPQMIAMAEELAPQKLEVAHVQYYGWAFRNREQLLPTCQQVDESIAIVESAQKRLAGRMRIEYVTPDYYGKYPKACMGGWGRKMMLIHPSGRVLPCHAAEVIPDLRFESVRERPLRWIWEESTAFLRFRGEAWMPEPCRSCDRRAQDFGGCRCQAFLLTGDAAATDPVCILAPKHAAIEKIVAAPAPQLATPEREWIYRL